MIRVSLVWVLLIARPAGAQVWEPRDPSRPFTLAVGPAVNSGGLGGRLTYRVGNSPMSVGLGVGILGFTPQLDVVFGANETQSYLGIGILVGYAGTVRETGTLTIDIGRRQWMANERSFFDFGITVLPTLWGEPNWGLLALGCPRAQIGFTF